MHPFTPTHYDFSFFIIIIFLHTVEGSVHDEEWMECFIDRHQSDTPQVHNDSTDDSGTPPMTEKLKHSSSHSSLNGLLTLV